VALDRVLTIKEIRREMEKAKKARKHATATTAGKSMEEINKDPSELLAQTLNYLIELVLEVLECFV
jgi:hypothetical protein